MKRRTLGQSRLFATAKHGQPERPPIEDEMSAAGIPRPEAEYVFARPRRWAFDYAWPQFRIALEIEGGAFGRLIVIIAGHERRKGRLIPIKRGTSIRVGGRHNTGEGLQNDCEKYNAAAIRGWMVIRATTTMVRDGLAIRVLQDAFSARAMVLGAPLE
jgi:hypothetical protein